MKQLDKHSIEIVLKFAQWCEWIMGTPFTDFLQTREEDLYKDNIKDLNKFAKLLETKKLDNITAEDMGWNGEDE